MKRKNLLVLGLLLSGCASTPSANQKEPVENTPASSETTTPDAQILRAAWADGDVFVVDRTTISKNNLNGSQKTTACTYKLEVEKLNQGYRVRQTGLLLEPIAEDASLAEFDAHEKMLTCLLNDIIVNDDFQFVRSEPVENLSEIHDALRTFYSKPHFEKGMADLMIERLFEVGPLEAKSRGLWSLLIESWQGLSVGQLGAKRITCANGDLCLDFTASDQMSKETLSALLGAKVLEGGRTNTIRIITNAANMRPELLEYTTESKVTLAPNPSGSVRVDAVSAETFHIRWQDKVTEM